MAWSTPRTWVTGEVVTASLMQTVRDNLLEVETAKMTAAEDIPVASGANALKRLAVTTGKVLGAAAGVVGWITDQTLDLVTTAGDLLYGTAADTLARLSPSSAARKALRLNSGGTAPTWLNDYIVIGHLYHSDAFAPAQAERWMVLTPAAAASAPGITTKLWVPCAGDLEFCPWSAANTLTTATITFTWYKNGASQGTTVLGAGTDQSNFDPNMTVVAGDYIEVSVQTASGGSGTVDDAVIVMTLLPTY